MTIFVFIDLEFNVLIRPHWVWQKITNSNIIVFPGNDTSAFKSFETTIETTNNSNVCLVVLLSNMKSYSCVKCFKFVFATD